MLMKTLALLECGAEDRHVQQSRRHDDLAQNVASFDVGAAGAGEELVDFAPDGLFALPWQKNLAAFEAGYLDLAAADKSAKQSDWTERHSSEGRLAKPEALFVGCQFRGPTTRATKRSVGTSAAVRVDSRHRLSPLLV
jgi:hypothetical protein